MVDMYWPVQDAKQRLSEVLRKAHTDGPQIVTKHGQEIAVVIDIEDYHRLAGHGFPSFNEALLSMPKVDEQDVFERRRDTTSRATPQLGWD